MEPIRKFNHQTSIMKAVALLIGTCTAAGIVAIELLNGKITHFLHILSMYGI